MTLRSEEVYVQGSSSGMGGKRGRRGGERGKVGLNITG